LQQNTGTTTFNAADVLESLGQALIVTDLEGTVVRWNKGAENLYGWTAEEALGQSITSLSVPEMAQDVAEEIMAALRNGVPWTGGFPVQRKDGSLFTALVTDTGIYHDGELVGIVGLSTNLGTALEPLLERTTDAALVVRADAVITFASSAVEQLFGWEHEAIIGSSLIPLLHPDDLKTLADVLEKVVVTPGAHAPFDLRVRSDGAWRWAEATLTNFLDDPVVRGVVCNLRRSPAREAREEAEVLVDQLQTALDSRVLIEQAKGFLAARLDIDLETAFQRLRHDARSRHQSLHDASRQVLGDTYPSGS
jgi:PAS domain S-box-containing protein